MINEIFIHNWRKIHWEKMLALTKHKIMIHYSTKLKKRKKNFSFSAIKPNLFNIYSNDRRWEVIMALYCKQNYSSFRWVAYHLGKGVQSKLIFYS